MGWGEALGEYFTYGCLPFGSVWANGKQISVLGKFRSGLALTICRNPYHLPKNLHDGDG